MIDDSTYNYFPCVTIGGPAGDYNLQCPVLSCRTAEYAILGIAYPGSGNPGTVVVSGNAPPLTPDTSGLVIISADTSLQGQVFRCPDNGQLLPPVIYNRITHSDKKVFVRLDPASNKDIYVTIKFRVKPIKVVPGPATTVHPDHQHQMNIAREDTIKERLKKMGIPAYAEEVV